MVVRTRRYVPLHDWSCLRVDVFERCCSDVYNANNLIVVLVTFLWVLRRSRQPVRHLSFRPRFRDCGVVIALRVVIGLQWLAFFSSS